MLKSNVRKTKRIDFILNQDFFNCKQIIRICEHTAIDHSNRNSTYKMVEKSYPHQNDFLLIISTKDVHIELHDFITVKRHVQ